MIAWGLVGGETSSNGRAAHSVISSSWHSEQDMMKLHVQE